MHLVGLGPFCLCTLRFGGLCSDASGWALLHCVHVYCLLLIWQCCVIIIASGTVTWCIIALECLAFGSIYDCDSLFLVFPYQMATETKQNGAFLAAKGSIRVTL